MTTTSTCTAICVCKARNAQEAARRAARMVGVSEGDAEAVIAMLRNHGWVIERGGPYASGGES